MPKRPKRCSLEHGRNIRDQWIDDQNIVHRPQVGLQTHVFSYVVSMPFALFFWCFLRCSAMFHRALPRVLPHPSNQLIWTSTISCNQSTQSIAQKSGPFAKIWRLIVRSFFTCTCNQWCKRYPAFFGQSMLNRIDFMLVCVSLLYVNIILYCIHGCMLSSWPFWP